MEQHLRAAGCQINSYTVYFKNHKGEQQNWTDTRRSYRREPARQLRTSFLGRSL